ncbi:MAG: hypothetical protein EWM47_02375 [Anaerolineaceae bacterium]|nr:MAG: hypothetical protein EWM47_02375 [Anaerolineaceae bacterium]
MNEKNDCVMRYVAGIDGGGTKTACMISDNKGNILSYVITDGSNHQIYGLSRAVRNVTKSIQLACSYAGLSQNRLSYIYMGMAGADLPEDIISLTSAFKKEFGGIPFEIVNDRWNAFACEANDIGAVSICGTGSSMAVRGKGGNVYSTRALRYVLGNYGGGNHLSEMALHHAFRCDESTGKYTRLVEELPKYCDCSSMDELANQIYLSEYKFYKKYNISKLVFRLAFEGDMICKNIISNMGMEMGSMVAGLIKKAGLEHEEVPVVLSGTLYVTDVHKQLMQPFEQELRLTVPLAILQLVTCPPVIGAIFMALEKINVRLTIEEKSKMKSYDRLNENLENDIVLDEIMEG